jgi:hypothetical protein
MTTYRIRFVGRCRGALGVRSEFVADRVADGPDGAVAALYDEFEHITPLLVTEERPL